MNQNNNNGFSLLQQGSPMHSFVEKHQNTFGKVNIIGNKESL